ncbi:DUF3466 family protein, partial [Okeania sp.]|uniref:DUF3466 family protein n=1 Tax=Okeania sp. TaxID=3100323 RepID=UPI002B4B6758
MNNQVNATSQTVASALTTAENYLQLFANHTNFLQKMVVAFGNNFNPQNALGLQSDWLVRDLSFIPPIEIRESAEINGANGAFAGDKNRIYLSQEFLTANGGNVEVVATVLLEEIGHAVDWKLNSVDGLGDEGAIFAHLVRGDVLSQEYLEELRVEDDSATVWLDGELVEIEQATSYTVVDLGTLGGSESKAWAINNQGQVVGDAETSSGEVRAFIFTDENDNGEVDAEEIQDIRGSESKARDINDRGQVVGFLPPTSSPKAFVWDEENGMETLSGASRSAFGINNDGDIVGYFKVPPFNFHSIRWENGEAIPLNTPLPNNSWATSINDNDQIVGYTDVFGGVFHAFLWNEGTINAALDLGSLDGASNTQAWSINNRGEVVGQSGKKAFLWDSSKGIQDLGSLTTGSSASRAFGINNLTQVVGESDNKAFLWEDTNNNQQSDPNEVVDLNELIPDDSDWTLEVARDINDAGEIVGSGSLNGETHAFLLIPEKQQKSADLSVRKSDSADPVKLGETLTYTIEVTNNGPGNATDVTLTEQLPETVTFESASLEPEVRLRED